MEDFLRRKIVHARKRAMQLKEMHGENPTEKYNYYGGHNLGYWEGKQSAYELILDEILMNEMEILSKKTIGRKQMRIDIMTDIETLGTKPDSTIFQISAVAFDIVTGEHLSTFNQIADIEKNDTVNVTGSTIKWWLNTNKELLSELLNSGITSSKDLLREFYQWLCNLNEIGSDVYLWGNGILFDNKLIQHQLESIGLDYPIYYKNDRDVRTIVDLASNKLGISEKELKDQFNDDALVEHNALDDVTYQIRLVTKCYEVLIS